MRPVHKQSLYVAVVQRLILLEQTNEREQRMQKKYVRFSLLSLNIRTIVSLQKYCKPFASAFKYEHLNGTYISVQSLANKVAAVASLTHHVLELVQVRPLAVDPRRRRRLPVNWRRRVHGEEEGPQRCHRRGPHGQLVALCLLPKSSRYSSYEVVASSSQQQPTQDSSLRYTTKKKLLRVIATTTTTAPVCLDQTARATQCPSGGGGGGGGGGGSGGGGGGTAEMARSVCC